MKTIGFIDYYLSEWHANNYPAWIEEICKQTGKDFCVKYAWAEQDVSPVDGATTDEWCEKFGVQKCGTIEELCEKSDYILILSPSNPEKHLAYAEKALKFGKNTYIDKTFAPDYKTAKQIFDIAEKYGTKFFSTSALRYATELKEVLNPVCVMVRGGGSNIAEYIIHQIEMIVTVLCATPQTIEVNVLSDGKYKCQVDFSDGKCATMEFYRDYPFEISWTNCDNATQTSDIRSDYFKLLIVDILSFYESGVTSFDNKQTLRVMKIREGILKGLETLGKKIDL